MNFLAIIGCASPQSRTKCRQSNKDAYFCHLLLRPSLNELCLFRQWKHRCCRSCLRLNAQRRKRESLLKWSVERKRGEDGISMGMGQYFFPLVVLQFQKTSWKMFVSSAVDRNAILWFHTMSLLVDVLHSLYFFLVLWIKGNARGVFCQRVCGQELISGPIRWIFLVYVY